MIASVIDRAGDQLGDFLPRIAGALVLLVVGLLAAIVLGRLTRRALVRIGLDRFADRSGTSELLGQAGLTSSLSGLVGTAVRLTIVVVAVFASLTLLGLAFLSDSLNEGIQYIPRLLVALALVLIGVVLGAFTRAWLERTSAQLDFPVAIGPVVQVIVIVLFGLCAAVQLGVAVAPLTAIALDTPRRGRLHARAGVRARLARDGALADQRALRARGVRGRADDPRRRRAR